MPSRAVALPRFRTPIKVLFRLCERTAPGGAEGESAWRGVLTPLVRNEVCSRRAFLRHYMISVPASPVGVPAQPYRHNTSSTGTHFTDNWSRISSDARSGSKALPHCPASNERRSCTRTLFRTPSGSPSWAEIRPTHPLPGDGLPLSSPVRAPSGRLGAPYGSFILIAVKQNQCRAKRNCFGSDLTN